MTKVLSVEGLRLSVGQRLLYDGVDIRLDDRGMTALMGPMGTGKSSFLAWMCLDDAAAYTGEAQTAIYAGRGARPGKPTGDDRPACRSHLFRDARHDREQVGTQSRRPPVHR